MEQVARLASSNHELTNEVKDLEGTLEHRDNMYNTLKNKSSNKIIDNASRISELEE